MRPPAVERGRELVTLARELGFARAGVASVEPTRYEAEFRAWLRNGAHGSMSYIEEQADLRVDPARVLDGARSAVMVADLYAPRGSDDRASPGRGRVARYARGRDYHREIKRRLHELADTLRERFPGERTRAFVDSAPVMERELAARAGIGWQGKHTLTINARLGSWLVLGGVLTTLEIDPPPEQKPAGDHCGSCTRCIDACPTNAIEPYRVDGSRCISYLTIERRKPVDERYWAGIGDWLAGCDICQEVCPHNSARPSGRWSSGAGIVRDAYAPKRDGFDLLAVLGWDERSRREAFEVSALKRVTLSMMRRNAVIVAGNQLAETDQPALRTRIEAIARDAGEDATVRTTAQRVLERLG